MQDQLTREPTTPAAEIAADRDEPGFVDCRGQWQTLAESPEAS